MSALPEYRLCAVLSLQYGDVDVYGNHHGLTRLAEWLKERSGQRALALDAPPRALPSAEYLPLSRMIVEPDGGLLRFSANGDDLMLSGDEGEIARVLGGSVENLAASPATTNGISTHFHLNPRVSPELWASDSVVEVMVSYDDGIRD